MKLGLGALAFILSIGCGSVQAQPYRWTDAEGHTHYSDTPPPASATNVAKPDVQGGATGTSTTPYALEKAMKESPVTLYTAPSCKEACEQARAALNKRGVPFKEVQVWNEQTNAELKRVSGGTQVPVLIVGTLKQVGFAQSAFDDALDIAGYPAAGVLPARTQSQPGAPQGYLSPAQPGGEPAGAAAQEPEKLGPYAPQFKTEKQGGPAGAPGAQANKPGPYTPRFSSEPKQ
jgi:glutaredoxin